MIFHEPFQKKKLKDVLKHNKEEKQERDLGSRKQQIWPRNNSHPSYAAS